MEIHRSLTTLTPRPRCVAIGTFDGVHVGHRLVVETAFTEARASGIGSCVLTFDRHPLAVLQPHRQPRLLTPLKAKIALLASLHPDELVLLRFTAELAAVPPGEFCRVVLRNALEARVVVVGENFTYGARGAGNIESLMAAGEELGFRTIVVPLATARGKTISSTRIRRLLQAGALEEVREILGRPPSTHGTVGRGFRRGRELGVPTANLDVEAGTIFPGRGVYAARVLVDGQWYRAAVNVGHNPTFHDPQEETTSMRIEAFLLGFDEDIYGHEIRVDFLHKIRDEVRFSDPSELVERMRLDIEHTTGLEDPAYAEVGLG